MTKATLQLPCFTWTHVIEPSTRLDALNADRVEMTGLPPSFLPHHRTCGFPEQDGATCPVLLLVVPICWCDTSGNCATHFAKCGRNGLSPSTPLLFFCRITSMLFGRCLTAMPITRDAGGRSNPALPTNCGCRECR